METLFEDIDEEAIVRAIIVEAGEKKLYPIAQSF